MNLQKNKFITASLVLGFLGFLDSTYLTILHYKNAIPPCSAVFGCEKVLTSVYSMIGPFPLALFGVIFYLVVLGLCLLIILENMEKLLNFFYFVAVVGFLVSFILFLIQLGLIHSFCEFCLLSELLAAGIAVSAFLHFRKERKNEA